MAWVALTAIQAKETNPGNLGAWAQEKPCLESGKERMRFPVTAKMALQTAGKTGGKAGSPSPVGGLSVFRKWTSISGVDIINRFSANFKVYLGLYKEPRDFPNSIAVIHNQDALRHRRLLQRVAFVAALVSPETVATIR